MMTLSLNAVLMNKTFEVLDFHVRCETSWLCFTCSKLKKLVYQALRESPNNVMFCQYCCTAFPGVKKVMIQIGSLEARYTNCYRVNNSILGLKRREHNYVFLQSGQYLVVQSIFIVVLSPETYENDP